jgi:hypothetical protein
MTFIKGLSNSVSIFVNPESQTEQTSQSQPPTNLGIANSADAFETTTANSFEFLQPPQENPEIQQSPNVDQTVDASSLFSYVVKTEPPPDARLQELRERLDSINVRRKEIRTESQNAKNKAAELQQMAAEIRGSANDNKALSSSIMATLGGLGVVGLIGGFPAPIIGGLLGGLGIFGGLSEAYKEKMYKAAAELDKQAGELQMQSEESNSELCECDNEASSIKKLIDEEERKLTLGLDQQEFRPSLMSVEGPLQEFQPDGIFKQDDVQSAVILSPDIQKLTNED